mgnify:CR=1 FL=1
MIDINVGGKEMSKIDLVTISKDEEINMLIDRGNAVMKSIGYTEHSKKHAARVASRAGWILQELGYSDHVIELAKIAGFMHDIGNSINRSDHAHSGAMLAYGILKDRGMAISDAMTVMTAIGHHDESTGTAVDPVSAALILADKTDVRRNRVQKPIKESFDIHDRVNYAALSSELEIDNEDKVIQLNLELDDNICSLMDYFEIFLQRMIMSKRAAEVLGYRFKLIANGSKLC